MACESLTEDLSGLEERSTDGMQNRMDGLAACVSVLIQSQKASMTALQGLLNAESNFNEASGQLKTSLSLLKAAEKQLSKP